MLGVGRSYVSRVIQKYKAEGVLETGRGSLRVVNGRKLKACSCRCNDSVKMHFDVVLCGVYPDAGK
jgi:transposase